MADIAPLGFSVDTKPLLDAAKSLDDVTTAADKTASATEAHGKAAEKSAEGVKKATEAHKEHAKALDATAKAADALKGKVADVSATTLQNAKDELAARERIHAMIERSLSTQQKSMMPGHGGLGGYIPKDRAAQSFERSVEMTAASHIKSDPEQQLKAAKATSAQTKEFERLVAVVDPAQAKIAKLEKVIASLGKQFDAGKLSLKEYTELLNKAGSQMDSLENPQAAGAHAGHRFGYHNPLAEAIQISSYQFRHFGRAARGLFSAGEHGTPLGPLLGMAGGALAGVALADGLRMLSKIPEELAKATDEAEKLQRRFTSFGGSSGELERLGTQANALALHLADAAKAQEDFNNAFTRLPATRDQQNAAFTAVLGAGRLGGQSDEERTKTATDFAGMVNKGGYVSGADISGLRSESPKLVDTLAKGMGVSADTLQAQASAGLVTGKALLDSLLRMGGDIDRQNKSMRQSAEEITKSVDNERDKIMAHLGDAVLRITRGFGLKVLQWVNGDAPAAAPGDAAGQRLAEHMAQRQQALHPDLALQAASARGGLIAEKYRSYESHHDELGSDLAGLNAAIAAEDKLHGSTTALAQSLREAKRELVAMSVEAETPFKRLSDQLDDVTTAFGKGGDSSSLIGVWQQALGIQREQERLGHGVAGSLQEIVDKLIAIKRAQQAINDTDELKKLSDAVGADSAQIAAMGKGSYEEQLARFKVEQKRFYSDRAELGGGGSPAAATSGGAGPVSQAVSAVQTTFGRLAQVVAFLESGNRDYKASGAPVRSGAGALYAMQVMPATAHKPGYGIAPVRNESAAEYDRVGLQLLQKDLDYYGGDAAKAMGAYHSGRGAIGHLGPKGRQYVSRGLHRLGLGGDATATVAANDTGSAPDLTNQVGQGRMERFLADLGVQAAGKIKTTDSASDKSGLLAMALQGGANPAQIHALELQLKVADAVKDTVPAYREAMKASMERADQTEITLASEQKIAQLAQQSADNRRRATAAATGDKATMAALELQLKIEEIKRQPGSPAEQTRQIAAVTSDTSANSSKALGDILGKEREHIDTLKDQLALARFTGDEYDLQVKLLASRRQIEDNSVGLSKERVAAVEAENEALIRASAQLEKQLALVMSIKDSFHFATTTIGTAWSNMFADFERHGVMHISTLIRGIEDGFYGMLDRMYQKLVISPLMSIMEKLMGSLLNSVVGSLTGGPSAALLTNNGSTAPITNTATGGVFNSAGVVPFAGGGMFNTPTRFGYGSGQGLAGEGPGLYEAIVPLKRGPDGKLGVSNTGGGRESGVQVVINDHRGPGAEAVEIQQRRSGDGMRMIEVMIRDAQRSNIRSGRVDTDMATGYGIRRPAARR